ncbi:MAG: DUF2147 domain-containing protein [Acinetobacter bohemicus]|jgi:uncharacterized protein (DUF2147 family)|uniref:DUF2147 domain-containing protein n=2 Tax=Acinetobacter bohemicus TaxID=1435036 RepID=N8QD68_9GAMM|nr:DUF2147 domain-containing protein [Acinetobacter bohemicus]MBO6152238.1 DUF2147 domain-containing protein [Acinetobacter sp.]ENU19249.1 hypothetical protein F994_02105 [Acinetobacter bohemicus ANC 3994]KAB0653328.1 DUF2147 domain-containing protein [Acinetobacter bohemicus]MBP8100099.1 DUF2147 domain-containing protein [Acinetobacter sp.]MBP8207678.1 DUF2147 domain-containing protein [Acinetobacter sp.]
MKTIFGIICIALLSSSAIAQNIVGTWRYIDDKTGEAKGLVKIEQQADGTYAGTALKSTPRVGYTPKEFCTNCPAPYTNKPIIGMQVISGLKTEDQINYTNGKIIDPVSGKFYRLKGKISTNGKKLFLRGYMGVSAVGRSQTWLRVE